MRIKRTLIFSTHRNAKSYPCNKIHRIHSKLRKHRQRNIKKRDISDSHESPKYRVLSKSPARRPPRCRGLRGCTQKCGFAMQGDGSVLTYMTEAARAKRIYTPTSQAPLQISLHALSVPTLSRRNAALCSKATGGTPDMTEAARAKRIYTPTSQALSKSPCTH